MNVVIYARYSSHSQNEQTIESQLEDCREYAHKNGYTVIGEYIDKKLTGTTDKRPDFQRMIEDSAQKRFEAVIVWKLDRFARNRFDSAIYKERLRRYGVRVISAKETISDDPAGVLVEGVLESMAEYYSVNLSQNIRRGLQQNAEKHLFTGSHPGFGFAVNGEKRIVIDPATAHLVPHIFEMYADGQTIMEIVNYLNAHGIKTTRGNSFNRNSLRTVLSSKKYIGVYAFKGTETPDVLPRLVEDELFDRVQRRLQDNKKAPARGRAQEEYILSTKLYCGHCRNSMIGYSGTSKSGAIYRYYICQGMKKRKCKKKAVRKDWLENYVLTHCRAQLTDQNIAVIVREVAAVFQSDYEHSVLKHLRQTLRDTEKAIDHLLASLELGQAADVITERIAQRSAEKKALQEQIAEEERSQYAPSEDEILFFLTSLKNGDINDAQYRRMLINIFINRIYLYDDKLTLFFNTGTKTTEVTNSLLNETEQVDGGSRCSSVRQSTPPK
ncbi:MAG: recombinase family protein [Eubacteriales bacterium]|nr:recombinase family protein [Eubacteriales bacterium]